MVVTEFENYSEEWKELWKNEYLHTVAALYNTAGGVVSIGRKDDGTTVGVKDPKKTLKSISDTITNKLHIKADVRLVSVEGKDCIRIIVPKGESMIDCDGVFYIRVGNTTQTVSGSELKNLLLKEKNEEWLDQLTDLTVDDLSFEAISYFISRGQNAERIPKQISAGDMTQILSKYDLISLGKVTLAGALLFSNKPRAINHGAYLKIGQFDEKDSLMRDTYIEGPLVCIPDLAMEKLYEAYIPPIYMYDGGGASRYLKYDFPEEAVRELILNAIMHMDYSLQRPVTVAIYPDRLEVFCAGGLPEGMTMDLLTGKHGSVLRNSTLASVLYSAGYVEAWGQGISKVREGCLANGNPEPEFQEFCGGILAIIHKSQKNVEDNVRAKITISNKIDREILRLIIANPRLNAPAISEELGISAKTVLRHLSALRDSGIVSREGGTRGGQWTIEQDIEL